MFFGWMRTNEGRNVCLFNTVKIKVCSPVITTDWDRPSQATVTQSVIPLRQQPWLTNWTTLTGIASFLSYYCRGRLSFKLTKLVSIHQILTIMDSRGTLLDWRDSTDQTTIFAEVKTMSSQHRISQSVLDWNESELTLPLCKFEIFRIEITQCLYFVSCAVFLFCFLFWWMRKNGGLRRGPRPNKQKKQTKPKSHSPN